MFQKISMDRYLSVCLRRRVSENAMFINPGDKIKIDTRTGEYLERCKA